MEQAVQIGRLVKHMLKYHDTEPLGKSLVSRARILPWARSTEHPGGSESSSANGIARFRAALAPTPAFGSQTSKGRLLAPLGSCKGGGTVPLCPSSSDVDLLGYGESVVDLDAEITHRALNLLVPQQKLHCPQVARAAVDECRLGSAQ